MSTTLRNRKAPSRAGPPVPPKPTVSLSLSQRRGRAAPTPPAQLKPLPQIPASRREDELKPLPRPPARLRLGETALWVVGFAAWFAVVVVLLPVVMEREAMIVVNAWLRGVWWGTRTGE